jgi:hypothetical protein
MARSEGLMNRSRLANRRSHDLHTIVHAGMAFTIGIGRYGEAGEGPIGECFLDVTSGKVGTAIEAMTHDLATIISIALQHGTPLAELRSSVSREGDIDAQPSIDNPPQSIAGALLDLLAAESDR